MFDTSDMVDLSKSTNDYNPFFKLDLVEVDSSGSYEKLASLGDLFSEQLTSIKFTTKSQQTRGTRAVPIAVKPDKMTISFEFGVNASNDGVPPLPDIAQIQEWNEVISENLSKATLYNRFKVIFSAGCAQYEMDVGTPILKLHEGSLKVGKKQLLGEETSAPDSFLGLGTKTLGGLKLLRQPEERVLFTGVMGNPTSLTGDPTGIMKSTHDIHLQSIMFDQKIGSSSRGSLVQDSGVTYSAEDLTFELKAGEPAKGVILRALDKYLKRPNLEFKTKDIDSALTVGENDVITWNPRTESLVDFFQKFLIKFNVNYTILPKKEREGTEVWYFYTMNESDSMNANNTIVESIIGEQPPFSRFAYYMEWGRMVTHFTYSYTMKASSSGKGGKKGKTEIVVQKPDGSVVSYELDKEAVEAFAKANGIADGLAYIEAIAKTDPNRIVEFYDAVYRSPNGKKEEVKSGKGKGFGALKLQLTLKYPLTTITPDDFIYFVLPYWAVPIYGKFLIRVYRVIAINNTFNPKAGTWKQVLECEH